MTAMALVAPLVWSMSARLPPVTEPTCSVSPAWVAIAATTAGRSLVYVRLLPMNSTLCAPGTATGPVLLEPHAKVAAASTANEANRLVMQGISAGGAASGQTPDAG